MPLNNLLGDFVQQGADRVRNLVGSVVTKAVSGINSTGPLKDLHNDKKAISKLQYPIDLGNGPYVNYIKFSILKSVGIEGTNSSEQFGGITNQFRRNSNLENLVNNVQSTAGELVAGAANFFSIDSETQTGIKNFAGELGIGNFSTQRRVKSTGTVIALYMPPTMVFSQTNGYSDFSYTQQLGMALAAAQGLDAAASGDLSTAGNAALEAAGRAVLSDDVRSALTYGFTGKALNPQLEVIYQETPLRTFQFEFVLAARSKAEQAAIKEIIYNFRNAAAPSFEGAAVSGRYLIPPDEFDIEFCFNGLPNENLPRLSTCVLTSIVTDFAPSGQFTTFSDGSPMSIRLALEFKEVDIITKQRVQQGF